MTLFVACLASYLLGSIPVGYLVARANGIDIMSVGSGNIGATNIHRALGAKASIPVFLLDVAKGWIPAFTWLQIVGGTSESFAVGICAVIGHSLSPWLRFKGGKGIATGFGALIGCMPAIAFMAFGAFLVTLFFSRYVSLSSLVAAVTLVALTVVFHQPVALQIACAVFAAFIFYRHRANISRLLAGTESKFQWKKPQVEQPPTAAEPNVS